MKEMNSLMQKYNDALEAIVLGDYEHARALLQQADREAPGIPLINKVLGNVELLTGYPHSAVARWNRFSLEELGVPADRKEWAESLLLQYDEVYERYNNGVGLIQAREFDKALKVLETLIASGAQNPLPVTFYRAYWLLLARSGNLEPVIHLMDQAPVYVRHSQEIQHLRKRLEAAQAQSSLVISRKRAKRFKTASAASIVLIVGLLGTIYAMSHDETNPFIDRQAIVKDPAAESPSATPTHSAEAQTADAAKEEVQKLTEQVKVLEAERTAAQDKLTAAEDAVKERENLISLSGTSESVLRFKAADKQYKDGMKLFRAGLYEEAAQAFAQSGELGIDTYFADDNLYFWIESLRKLNQPEKAAKLSDQFLAKADKNFTESPYTDDVLLFKAEYLFASNQKDAASQLFEKLIADYPNEWTADRARQLIQKNV